MDTQSFYGCDTSQTISYLEFGEINLKNQKKNVWDFRLHQKAYDWLMLGRYANDYLAYTRMNHLLDAAPLEQIFAIYNEEVHHADDAAVNFDKLIALSHVQHAQKNISFFELGQTIFGCIEGIEFYQNLITFLGIPFKTAIIDEIDWHGIDISSLFNLIAGKIHQHLNVSTQKPSPEQIIISDIFYAKGITLLYSIKTIDQLFSYIDNCQLSIFDYSFSMDDVEVTTIGTGKTVAYLNFKEFIKKYNVKDKQLYVKSQNSRLLKDSNRIWLDCLYADDKLIKAYVNCHNLLKTEIITRLKDVPAADQFLGSLKTNEWLTVDDFLERQSINL